MSHIQRPRQTPRLAPHRLTVPELNDLAYHTTMLIQHYNRFNPRAAQSPVPCIVGGPFITWRFEVEPACCWQCEAPIPGEPIRLTDGAEVCSDYCAQLYGPHEDEQNTRCTVYRYIGGAVPHENLYWAMALLLTAGLDPVYQWAPLAPEVDTDEIAPALCGHVVMVPPHQYEQAQAALRFAEAEE